MSDFAKEQQRRCCCMPGRSGLLAFCVCFIAIDSLQLYGGLVRATRSTQMPFWGNAAIPLVAGHPEVNWADVLVSTIELGAVSMLFVGVRSAHVEHLRFGLCGFSVALVAEVGFLFWLMALVVMISVAKKIGFSGGAVLFILLILPYAALLAVRVYGLMRLHAHKRLLIEYDFESLPSTDSHRHHHHQHQHQRRPDLSVVAFPVGDAATTPRPVAAERKS